MRADATRNMDAVLQTGARLLAVDPGASIAAIAAAAGVDRRTVYRRFASREALLGAVLRTKLEAIAEVLTDSRLPDAPVAVALHRFVEGIIAVDRRYPVDQESMPRSPEASGDYARMVGQRELVEAFLRRAADEGVLRSDLPDGLALVLLRATVKLLAIQFTDLEPAYAADIAVDTLLNGIGRK